MTDVSLLEDESLGPRYVVVPKTISDIEKCADWMAESGPMVPPHCRGNTKICQAIIYKALTLGLPDFLFLAEHSYRTVQRQRQGDNWVAVERIAYDASAFHAIIAASRILAGVPEYDYEGVRDERICTVTVRIRTSGQVVSYTTPPLSQIRPEVFEKDGKPYCKGSQLWIKDPDMQLGYFGIRNLARKYFPHVLGGIYDREELEESHIGPEHAKDVSPNLMERLPGRIEGDGFQPDAVELQREEAQAVAVVQAEKAKRRGRPPGSRNKKAEDAPLSMKDIPNIEPIPDPAEVEYATSEAEGAQ